MTQSVTESSISPGPLSPFMEKELLKDTDLSMNGDRLEKVVAFEYEKPKMTKELIEEVIESYKKMRWWPNDGIEDTKIEEA